MKIKQFTGPKWAKSQADARKADRDAIKSGQGSGGNVNQLRDRIDRLERALGMVPGASR